MRLPVILLCLISTPVFACCVFDNDFLADELLPWPGAAETVTGRVERYTPAWHLQRLDLALANKLPGSELDNRLAAAAELDQLNRQTEAVNVLNKALEGLQGIEAARVHAMLAQVYIHMWWLGGTDSLSPEECRQAAGTHVRDHPQAAYLTKFLQWAALAEKADPKVMLPDFFGLRLAGNKLAISATSQLADAGVPDAPAVLLGWIRLHPVWENFDTFHALSLAWAVDGRQPASHLARLRAWEMHKAGQRSRVPGIESIETIRRVTVLHIYRGESFTEKLPVDEAYRGRMAEWFKEQRRHADAWHSAREFFINDRLKDGLIVDDGFWDGFVVPPPPTAALPQPDVEPANTSEPAPVQATADEPVAAATPEETTLLPWFLIGGLLVMLSVGFITHKRVTRKEPEPTP